MMLYQKGERLIYIEFWLIIWYMKGLLQYILLQTGRVWLNMISNL